MSEHGSTSALWGSTATAEALAPATARVQEVYERVDEGDLDGLGALFSDDIVYRRPGYPDMVGKAAVDRFYRWGRMIDHGLHTPDSIVGDGDRYAVQGRFEGRLKNGRDVCLRFADFFVMDDEGRFCQRDTFFFTPLV